MYDSKRVTCEQNDLEKPGKYDSYEWRFESLKMVSPDCDTKRAGPCKPLASSTNLKGNLK